MAISLTLFYGSPNAHNGAAASLGSIARASQKLNAIALSQFRVSLTAVLFLTSLAPCGADPAPVIHYAPIENLEHVDVALIDRARHEIDMAAYVLTDWPVGSVSAPAPALLRFVALTIRTPHFPWSAGSRKEGRSPEMILEFAIEKFLLLFMRFFFRFRGFFFGRRFTGLGHACLQLAFDRQLEERRSCLSVPSARMHHSAKNARRRKATGIVG